MQEMNLELEFLYELFWNDFRESIHNPIKLFSRAIQFVTASGQQYLRQPIQLPTKMLMKIQNMETYTQIKK